MSNDSLRQTINAAYERRAELMPDNTAAEIRNAVETAVGLLDCGEARVAEKCDGRWQVNEWLKKAVLLYFRLQPNQVVEGGGTHYYDKIPLKYTAHTRAEFKREGTRVVPPATVR